MFTCIYNEMNIALDALYPHFFSKSSVTQEFDSEKGLSTSFLGVREKGRVLEPELSSFLRVSEKGSLEGPVTAGSGPQLKPAGGLVADVAKDPFDFFSWTDFPCRDSRCRCPWLGVDESAVSAVSREGRFNEGVCVAPPSELNNDELSANSFFGSLVTKSRSEGGAGASAACLLSRGSLRTLRRALFSLCAARSAFRAAAVVAATLGVVSDIRLPGLDLKSIAVRLGLMVRSSFDKRCERRATSSAC